jgi:secondary thiamine-phosphate synthase enzyme
VFTVGHEKFKTKDSRAMKTYHETWQVRTHGKGTIEITREVAGIVARSGVENGTVTVFVRHTSASLVIMENADPSARRDLEVFFDKLVPENTPWFIHTQEGPDDMPSHIRMALTRTSEVIPVMDGRMTLGTWQGIFLFEHRRDPHRREIVCAVIGE